MTGDQAWQVRAEQLLTACSGQVNRYPGGFTQMLQAAAWLLEPARKVIVAGRTGSRGLDAMLQAGHSCFVPETVFLQRPEPLPADLEQVAPHLAAMSAGEKGTLAYVCRNFTCLEPTDDCDNLYRTDNPSGRLKAARS